MHVRRKSVKTQIYCANLYLNLPMHVDITGIVLTGDLKIYAVSFIFKVADTRKKKIVLSRTIFVLPLELVCTVLISGNNTFALIVQLFFSGNLVPNCI